MANRFRQGFLVERPAFDIYSVIAVLETIDPRSLGWHREARIFTRSSTALRGFPLRLSLKAIVMEVQYKKSAESRPSG